MKTKETSTILKLRIEFKSRKSLLKRVQEYRHRIRVLFKEIFREGDGTFWPPVVLQASSNDVIDRAVQELR